MYFENSYADFADFGLVGESRKTTVSGFREKLILTIGRFYLWTSTGFVSVES